MIQLHENDFLWKCYDRYYKGELANQRVDDKPPHPRSICNFFWKAIGGICKAAFWDSPALIVSFFSIAICIAIWWFSNDFFVRMLSLNESLLFVFCIGSTVWSIIFISMRWYAYWFKRGKHVVNIASLFFLLFLFGSFAFSLSFQKDHRWHIEYLPYGMLMCGAWIGGMALFAGIIVGICCLKSSSTGKIVMSYIKSLKNKVCPLVKAPWEKDQSPPPTSGAC